MTVLVSNSLPRSLRRERASATRTPARIWANWAWLPVAAALGLSLVGIAAIGTTEAGLARRQLGYLIVGMVMATAVGAQHWKDLRRWAWVLLAINAAALLFVLLPWVPESVVRPRNGARRWINVGSVDMQPSELVKLTWVLAMAAWMQAAPSVRRLSGVAAAIAVTLVPVGLIAMQPDLDSALLFLPCLGVMLVAAGARIKHLAIIAVLGLALAPLSYPFLKPHQRDRIQAMVAQVTGDTRVNDGIGFQGSRAITLAASGGVAGLGREEASTLIRFNRLPEEHNDMIFVVIACRWGLLGGLAVWVLGAAYAFGAYMVASRAGTAFGRLAAVGIGSMVFLQLSVNTAMTIGLLPVSGMTLPFVSYGGSSLVCLWMTTAVLFSIASRRPRGFDL
ncbi:MAG: FtsW/RodA/SpoVE family cell cycle protein [Phycisphaerales bacterium]